MHALVPDFILSKMRSGETSGKFYAFVLFADIKGFTAMTETLMKENDKGSEILSSIINETFGAFVSSIHNNGGFVATFAGDAFTAVFPGDSCASSERAAEEIVGYTKKNSIRKTRMGDFEIAVRVGIADGEVEWGVALGEESGAYYFRGEAIDLAADAESKALPNEISVIKSKSEKRTDAGEKTHSCSGEEFQEEASGKFYRTGRMPERFTGEFRDVASLFISFKGYDTHNELKDLLLKFLEITDEYKGYFNTADFGDKGAKAVILFGAPLSNEKNLERAIQAAKSIVAADAERIRAGLTFGRVYAGYVGSGERCTYTVLGDKVNLSARIMGKSSYGEVWTEESAAEEMKWKFDFHEIGEMEFKGKAQKTRVFSVRGKKNLSREEAIFENEIVGRDKEIESVTEMMEGTLLKGKFGGVVEIYGEPGVGKSRLMFELIQKSGDVCASLLIKNDDIFNRSLYPFEMLLKKTFNQINAESDKKRKEEFDAVWKVLVSKAKNDIRFGSSEDAFHTEAMLKGFLKISQSEEWNAMDAKLRLENTMFAIKHLFRILSLEKPLILGVEDTQWMDNDSNFLFRILSRKMDDYPMLIITTSRYRDDGSKVILPVEEECVRREIILTLLGLEESRDYISKQLIFSPSDALIEKIYEKTEGNPFYIEQISLYLIENELLEIRNDEYCMKREIEEIPKGVNSILIARIDRLTRELKEIVQSAAVLGREFEVDVLSRMLSGKITGRELEEGVNEKIWQPLNQIKYIFRHNMMRDAAYNMQLKNHLRDLHLVAAESLEKLHRNDREKYSDMAYHYEKGENFKKAKTFYREAGIDAKHAYKNHDADRYLRLAILYSEELDEKAELSLLLAEVLYQMGEWQRTKEIYDELSVSSEKFSDRLLAGKLNIAFSELLFERGDIEESKKHLSAAEEIFKPLNAKTWITKALMARGQILWRGGELEASEKIYNEALSQATELGNMELISEICMTIGNIYKDRSLFEKAMEYYERTKKITAEENLKTGLCGVLGNMGLIEWMKGDYGRAMDYFNEEMEIAKAIGSKYVMSYVLANMGSVLFQTNRFEEAEANFLKQLAIAEELGEKKNIRIALNNLGAICEMKGEYEKELEYFKRSLKIAEELNAKMGIRIVLGNIGNVYGKWGDQDKALDYFYRSLKLAEELDDKRGKSILKMNIALSYFIKDDIDSAEKNIDESLAIMREYSLRPNMPKALLEKAKILFKRAKTEECIKAIEEGEKILNEGDILLSHNEATGFMILKSKIKAAEDRETAVMELRMFADKSNDASDRGDIYFVLFELTKSEDDRKNALKAYREYYTSHPVYETAEKIKELGGENE